ncbi:MAG: hypothetical protein HY827_09725 [Actinobacteria bacterium]|nr:hypothetical protein [Actinomycetota bacterium]
MTKTKTAILVALSVAAIFAVPTTVASAGTYNVYQCHSAYGLANSGWRWNASGFGNGVAGCPSSFSLNSQHRMGDWMYWETPTLPGGMKFTQASFVYGGYAGTNVANRAGFCSGAYTSSPCTFSNSPYLPNLLQGTQNITATCNWGYYECNRMQFGENSYDASQPSSGWLMVWNLDFTINDPTAPFAWQPHNGTLRSDNATNPWTDGNYWNRGTRDTGVYGHDAGQSGVRQTRLYFDGDPSNATLTQDFTKSCNYAEWRPCPEWVGDTATINTLAFADGPHTATTRVVDAGGNVTEATTNFKVDNTPPAQPQSIVAAAETPAGWQSVNDFDVTWTNSGETAETTTQSGITRVCYDVDPGEGQPTDPAAVCASGAINSFDDIALPGDGSWSVKFYTQDRAGNESRKATRVLRLDTTVPGAPTGIANGWIGLAELISGRQQSWSRPNNWLTVNSGFCGYGFSVSAIESDEAPTTINVVGDVTGEPIPANTPEGINWAHFRAISCAGLYGPTESVEVKIDLTNPHAQVTGIPESGWTNAPGVVNVSGADATPGSGTNGAIDGDPVTSGASVRFELDGALSEEERGASAAAYDASGLSEGNHTLTVKTFDWARNFDQQTFNFGVDKTPPSGKFMGTDPDDPATFRVAANDSLSGVVDGTIEFAPIDADGNRGAFKPLATNYEAGTLTAAFPDSKLPTASYALRGAVTDAATNTGYATKDAHGHEMVITTPLREAVGLTLLASTAGKPCAKFRKSKRGIAKRRAAKRYQACKKKLAAGKGTDTRAAVAYGRASVLYGRLTDRRGDPMSNVKVELYEQRAGAPMRLVGGATTNGGGAFDYTAHAGPARNVIAYFPGNRRQRDVSATVTLNVAAKVSFRVSPGVVKGAKRFTFSGKVFAHDGVSAEGKLVQLQFYNVMRRRWQAGPALIRAGRDGKFRYSYAIKRSAVAREQIRFRAFVPAETSFPYGTGASRARTLIHVR